MLTWKSSRKSSIVALSFGLIAVSACSTTASSRYGSEHYSQGAVSCGTIMVRCEQVIEYYPVMVQPPAYMLPIPCPTVNCLPPPPEPPVVVHPPYEPPVIEVPPYVPPVIEEPPYLPPVVVKPPYEPPVVSCPDGSIPGYGGQDCIPITIPRK